MIRRCMIYHNRLLAMLSLTALLAVIVSSCNSTDEDIKVGTTVPVELALNVSTQQSTATNTRMTAEAVQVNGNFRGIQDWHLIPFAITPLPTPPTPPIAGGNPLSGAITPDLTQETGTYNFLDRNIIDATIGTNAYLCYARAGRTDTGTPDNFANGLTVASFDDNSPRNITFSPQQICSSTDFATKGSALLAYLNGIAQASVNDSENNPKTWTDDGGLERIFNSLVNYDEANGTYRLYAGSSVSIKALATMAYNAVNSLSYSDGTWQAALKTEILDKIKDKKEDQTTFGTVFTIDPTTSEITITSLGDSRDGFPASVKLPDGAAAVLWDNSANPKAFKYATRTTIPEDAVTNYQALVYPAELWYYANSPIKTSKSSQASNYNEAWSNVLLNHYNEGTSVVALDTRSIAITEPLQYGVGCIEAVVQAETTTEKLSDANSTAIPLFHLSDPNDNTSKVYHFPLTAVLFGGQYNQNFNFTPKSEGSQGVLYDPMMVGHAADNTETGTINLKPGGLVMENFANANDKFYTLSLQTRDNVDVNIVLEFQNNSGESFYGVNGLIAPGMRFYLVGTIKKPTTGGLPRVVTQDCKTQLIINVKSLQCAYNVIPDLNTAKTVLNVVDIAVAPWTDRGFKDHNVYNW